MSFFLTAVSLQPVGQVAVIARHTQKVRPLVGPGIVTVTVRNQSGKPAINIIRILDQARIEMALSARLCILLTHVEIVDELRYDSFRFACRLALERVIQQ